MRSRKPRTRGGDDALVMADGRRNRVPHRTVRTGAGLFAWLTVATGIALAPGASAQTAPAAEPVNLSRSPDYSVHPAVAAAGDATMVVWQEDDASWFTLRAGGSWSAPEAVPQALGAQPDLAGTPDGGFELVWAQPGDAARNEEILHSRFSSGVWSTPADVARTPGTSVAPTIAVADDGTRLVVWVEGAAGATGLYSAVAAAQGGWVASPLPGGSGLAPDLIYAGHTWHLTWVADSGHDGAGELRYRRRDTGGWSAMQAVQPGGPPASEPRVAGSADGDVAIVWLTGGTTVSHARWIDGAWSAPVSADGGETATGPAALALTGAGAVAAWPRYGDVRYAREIDHGWESPDTSMQSRSLTRDIQLATTPTGLGLVATARGVRDSSDVFFVDPDARPPTATPTVVPPTVTTMPVQATPAVAATAAPGRSTVYLPICAIHTRIGAGQPSVTGGKP